MQNLHERDTDNKLLSITFQFQVVPLILNSISLSPDTFIPSHMGKKRRAELGEDLPVSRPEPFSHTSHDPTYRIHSSLPFPRRSSLNLPSSYTLPSLSSGSRPQRNEVINLVLWN